MKNQQNDYARDLTYALQRILDSDRITQEDLERAKLLRLELMFAILGNPFAQQLAKDILERSEFLTD